MTLDITKTTFASPNDTFKNSTVVTQTFSVGAFSFPDGNAQIQTFNIPITRGETFSQVKVNLSFDSTKWHLVPLLRFGKYKPSAKTDMQVFANYTSSNLQIILSIATTGAAPWSYSAFSFTASAKLFITPA